MSDEIMRRESFLPDAPRVSPRLRREMNREVARAAARGVVRAAEVQASAHVAQTRIAAASLVTQVGLNYVAELSAEEACYAAANPQAAPRFKALVDQFTALTATEITRMGIDR